MSHTESHRDKIEELRLRFAKLHRIGALEDADMQCLQEISPEDADEGILAEMEAIADLAELAHLKQAKAQRVAAWAGTQSFYNQSVFRNLPATAWSWILLLAIALGLILISLSLQHRGQLKCQLVAGFCLVLATMEFLRLRWYKRAYEIEIAAIDRLDEKIAHLEQKTHCCEAKEGCN
ncbi:MAG: hypothetical protein RL095_4047 [Verrucomicrobiota bacterium]